MLTKIIGDRVYDFSHVVGGRDQVMGPLSLAFGDGGEAFAVVSNLGGWARTGASSRSGRGAAAGKASWIRRPD